MIRLNELQKHQLREALDNSSSVQNFYRRRTLKGKDLEIMKTLETAVSALEVVVMVTAGR
jgi:hypothetical protein